MAGEERSTRLPMHRKAGGRAWSRSLVRGGGQEPRGRPGLPSPTSTCLPPPPPLHLKVQERSEVLAVPPGLVTQPLPGVQVQARPALSSPGPPLLSARAVAALTFQ